MPIPPTITSLLAGGSALPKTLADTPSCAGAKFHSPNPLMLDEYELAPDFTVWLCGTCYDNLTVFTHLLEANDGHLSWEARREFGNLIRALGLKAWSMNKERHSA